MAVAVYLLLLGILILALYGQVGGTLNKALKELSS